MNKISIIILSSFMSLSSLGHESPVSIAKSRADRCGKSSHGGMGSIYTNSFEAEIKLRKQCQETPSIIELGSFCQEAISSLNYSKNSTLNDVAEGATNLYFKSYAADVLISEIEVAGHNPNPLPNCLRNIATNSKPHIDAREDTFTPKNMVSASVLMEIYDGGLLVKEFKSYTKRLTESFPMMFNPRKRGRSLSKLVKKSLGDKFKYSHHDGTSHADIMDAFNALYLSDETFRNSVDSKISSIKSDYAKDLKQKLKGICSKTPMDLQKEHPGIFKQAILDMTENQRLGANQYLCKQIDYYNPRKYDSDCDGEADKTDSEPLDPFSPLSEKSYSGRAVIDPPFGNDYDYDLAFQKNQLDLRTKLKFDISSLSKKDASFFKKNLTSCRDSLEKSMNESYEMLKTENQSFSGKMNTKIDLEFGEFDTPSFSVNECYCSDCIDSVVDPEDSKRRLLYDNYIDPSTCWEDLTKTQKEAVKKVFPTGEDRWRNRENASNLTTNVNCRTMKHEILHRFGLSDEYSDHNSYPYNRVACNLMGVRSLKKSNLIEGRQIEAIISRGQCK